MEEVLNEIQNAEKKAAEIRQAALDKSAEISARAQEKAAEISKTSQTDCAELLKTQIKNAEISAQDEYVCALSSARKDAEAEADKILKSVDGIVDEIVGRVCRGDS